MSRTVRYPVGDVVVEWDEAKARANWRKHGVSFEEAATVLLDEHQHQLEDPDDAHDEVRLLLIGRSFALRILLVVHVERGEALRIISARLATARERRMMRER